MTALEQLRAISPDQTLSANVLFDAICEAGIDLANSEREGQIALEIAIRLLDARRTGQLPAGGDAVVEFLAEECGLYPYVEPANFGLMSQTLIESHAIDIRGKIYLHSKQMQALLWLLGGDNVILSAPTSFGKSALVDAFIEKKKPHTVVMILPTIALIDETRRRIVNTFGESYTIISDTIEEFDSATPTIFILTQERLLNRNIDSSIDFLFVDEFYKLDPERDDGRYETLNLALYKYLPLSKQCFMAGPHIRHIDLGVHYTGNFRFIRTDYKTVTVNVIDRSSSVDRYDAFLSDLRGVGADSSLVFTSTPGVAQELLLSLMRDGIEYSTIFGQRFEEWVHGHYHPDWAAANGLARGVAIHHGKLPRSLAQLFVHLFDQQEIKALICTSTLIEGVNTSAANVFIYDKKIARSDFDFFSFANIRGRVGRMMRHFVGNAYLYHEPPQEIETDVSVPVFSDPNRSSDYLVMNVASGELTTEGRDRVERIQKESGLPPEIIRDHGAIGVDLLVKLRNAIRDKIEADAAVLTWSRFPNWEQRVAIAELALIVAHGKHEQPGLHAAKQVAWAWSQLSQQGKLAGFLTWFASTFSPAKPSAGVDMAFQFLQACEFTFPRSLGAVEALTNHLAGRPIAKFGHYISELEQWFRPPWMKQLDESGVPLPLAEKLRPYLDGPQSRGEALGRIRSLDLAELPTIGAVDRYILELALR